MVKAKEGLKHFLGANMAMSMYLYRVFVPLLLVLIHCKVTVEQETQGPLGKICSDTSKYNENLPMPPLAKEDEDFINALLGCSKEISGMLPESCLVREKDVICDCYLEDHTRCRVEQIDFSFRRLEGEIPEKIGGLQYLRSPALYFEAGEFLSLTPWEMWNASQEIYISGKALQKLVQCS
ncbi:uncharacterized protein LOC132037051 [Lycium ferocissimum]|uniref:uncharacterized protein LOC132037051 n=1 Tax=Lycium ferocissimum TaxID=112874 RepID=UPI002816429C|nr:uncharacterized protein LOC132037051 [Lycium ferocissimum]